MLIKNDCLMCLKHPFSYFPCKYSIYYCIKFLILSQSVYLLLSKLLKILYIIYLSCCNLVIAILLCFPIIIMYGKHSNLLILYSYQWNQ